MSACPTPTKRAFATETKARDAMLHAVRDGVDSGLYLNVYRCRGCLLWHWGHSGQRWRKAIQTTLQVGNAKANAARRPRKR